MRKSQSTDAQIVGVLQEVAVARQRAREISGRNSGSGRGRRARSQLVVPGLNQPSQGERR